MNLSEAYKKRLKTLSGVLEESKSKNEYEFQIRNIGGDVYYKRKKGSEMWEFIDELDFVKNSKKSDIIKCEKPKGKKAPKVKQLEIDQKLNFKKHPLETYKRYLENVCPSNFKIKIEDGQIKIVDKK